MHVDAVVRVQQTHRRAATPISHLQAKRLFVAQVINMTKRHGQVLQNRKTKTMETQITLLTKEQINNRVRNGGNSFTKEEMLAHRDEIKLARKEKKEWLGSLNEEEQLDMIRAAIRNGFQLQDTKRLNLKKSEKFTPVFIRKDEATALDNEEKKLLAKLEKITARKAELNAVAA